MSEITNDNVISTVALVLDGVINHIVSKLPGISIIYDENLGYDSGTRLLRDSNNLRDEFSNKLPAIFFRRSVLRYQEEGVGRRSVVGRIQEQVSPTESAIYRSVAGTFDLEFVYITTKISQMENFEISWLTEATIGQEKEISVTMPTIGVMPYFLKYNPLDDKLVNSQGNYYKSLSGTMAVRGNYFIAIPNPNAVDSNGNPTNGLYKHVTQVRKRIYGINGNFLESEIIS